MTRNATVYSDRESYDVLPDVANALIERGIVAVCKDHGYSHCPLLLTTGHTFADVEKVDTEVSRRSQRTVDIRLTVQEVRTLWHWIDTHGYAQGPSEVLAGWQERTAPIAYAYSQIVEALENAGVIDPDTGEVKA